MRIIILLLVTLFLTLAFGTARADNPNKCYWNVAGSLSHDYERREFSVNAPSTMKLQMVAVGRVMATSANHQVPGDFYRCPFPAMPSLRAAYEIAPDSGAELESGYKDVYKTGVAGIGVRFRVTGTGFKDVSIPASYSGKNGGNTMDRSIENLKYEFVRTAQGVGSGDLKLNFKIRLMVDQWYAANININGITRVETDSYFAGCAGVKKNINVPMGKVWAGDMKVEATPTQSFDLDVLCTGLPAGTKLPVKAYFEGDFRTAGRLRLPRGGAGGVEISLLNDQGISLPVYKANAMAMKWMRSEANGELYNLPIKARYVKIPGSSVTPGRADATLNYILEYN